MKVRPSVKRICEKCKIIKRNFLGQPFFVFLFDFHKVGHKFGVVDEVFNLLQKVKIGDPVVADLGRNERCQRRVGVVQPAPRSDAVGYVDEFFRPQFLEFLIHVIECSSLYRFQTIPDIREGSGNDNTHGIVNI